MSKGNVSLSFPLPPKSVVIQIQLLPHKPPLGRFLTALFALGIEALESMKEHAGIKEAI